MVLEGDNNYPKKSDSDISDTLRTAAKLGGKKLSFLFHFFSFLSQIIIMVPDLTCMIIHEVIMIMNRKYFLSPATSVCTC